MFCPNCQTENPEDSKFCVNCGVHLGAQPPQAPSQPTTPPSSPPDIKAAPIQPEKPAKSKKTFLIIGVVLLLLILVSAAGFFVFSRFKKPSVSQPPSPFQAQPSIGCLQVYQDLLDKYGENYDECYSGVGIETTECHKPTGFTDEFKENLNVVIILDSSGSMAQNVPGGQKMQIAKKVISDFVNSLPDRAKVGLMVYGHKGSNAEAHKAISCQGIELVYPLSELNKTAFETSVASFNPTGWTPIADSFQKAKEVLGAYEAETNSNLIYLVSDGIETCGGNPVEAARQLRESNIKAIVNIVGFDVNDQAQRQLQQAAQVGGGTYYQASTADEIKKVFESQQKLISQLREYRDCFIKVAREGRDVSMENIRAQRDCLIEKARKQRDNIQKETREMRDNRTLDWDCATTIIDKTWENSNLFINRTWEASRGQIEEEWSLVRKAIDDIWEQTKKDIEAVKK